MVAVSLGAPATIGRGEDIRIDSSILTASVAIDVPAPEAGVLRGLNVTPGSRVTANAVVANVDPRERRLLAEVAEKELAAATQEAHNDIRSRLAEKEHSLAKVELSRAVGVNHELPNTVSAKEIDYLSLAVERTKLQIEHAEFERRLLGLKIDRIASELRLAQHRIESMTVVTPITGVVTEVLKHTGEWVDQGETVVRVVRVDRLRLEGYVSVRHALTGLVGRAVEVSAAGASQETVRTRGRVVFVSPQAEPVNAQVRFWAAIDNRAMRLRSGLAVSAVIRDKQANPTPASTKLGDSSTLNRR